MCPSGFEGAGQRDLPIGAQSRAIFLDQFQAFRRQIVRHDHAPILHPLRQVSGLPPGAAQESEPIRRVADSISGQPTACSGLGRKTIPAENWAASWWRMRPARTPRILQPLAARNITGHEFVYSFIAPLFAGTHGSIDRFCGRMRELSRVRQPMAELARVVLPPTGLSVLTRAKIFGGVLFQSSNCAVFSAPNVVASG
jgi:hypothetical protein